MPGNNFNKSKFKSHYRKTQRGYNEEKIDINSKEKKKILLSIICDSQLVIIIIVDVQKLCGSSSLPCKFHSSESHHYCRSKAIKIEPPNDCQYLQLCKIVHFISTIEFILLFSKSFDGHI